VPAWRERPSWFVYGDADENIPAALQRFMAERAGAREVRAVPGASHAISVSQPDEVAATILAALEAVMSIAA
jgi:pimeloyl-ACP methyl ester carboxylesterase